MREVLKVFKALSDETRLRILYLLLERECCVDEVMRAMRISQTRASRNLGILHDADLLKVKRDGPWVLYSIDEKAMERAYAGLAEVIRNAFKDDKTAFRHQERLKRQCERRTVQK